MKVYVDMDERWPEYSVDMADDGYSKYTIEMDEELYRRYKAALSEFNEVQEEIEQLIKGTK